MWPNSHTNQVLNTQNTHIFFKYTKYSYSSNYLRVPLFLLLYIYLSLPKKIFKLFSFFFYFCFFVHFLFCSHIYMTVGGNTSFNIYVRGASYTQVLIEFLFNHSHFFSHASVCLLEKTTRRFQVYIYIYIS